MTQFDRNRFLPLIAAVGLACTMAVTACDVGEEEVVADEDTPYCFTWGDGSQFGWYNSCDGNVLRIDGCDGPIWAQDCGQLGQICVSYFDGKAACETPACFTWGDGSQFDWYNSCDGNVLRIDGCDGPIWAQDCGDYGQTCVTFFAGKATCQ